MCPIRHHNLGGQVPKVILVAFLPARSSTDRTITTTFGAGNTFVKEEALIEQTLSGLRKRIDEWREYRRGRRILLSLDDRALKDIGVTRSEIAVILSRDQPGSPRPPARHGRADFHSQATQADTIVSDAHAEFKPGTLPDNSQADETGLRRWWVLWTMVAAQFMFVVDAFIVNVAIPTIRADFHASPAQIEAVIAVYLISYASLVVVGGRLGDIYGAKNVFLLGLAGFTIASVWCGLAQSAPELIVARLVQGATAALMVPQVLATIYVIFPDGERARAFGFYGLALGLGGAAGFLLGGAIVTLDVAGLGWRMVYFVNAPFGLALAVAAWRLIILTDRPSVAFLALPLAVFGYGQGLVMAPLSSAVLSLVQKASAGAGSGTYNVTVQIANAAGVAGLGALFFTLQDRISDRAAILASLGAVSVVVAISATLLQRMHRAPIAR